MSTIDTVIRRLEELRADVKEGEDTPIEALDQLSLSYVIEKIDEVLEILKDRT